MTARMSDLTADLKSLLLCPNGVLVLPLLDMLSSSSLLCRIQWFTNNPFIPLIHNRLLPSGPVYHFCLVFRADLSFTLLLLSSDSLVLCSLFCCLFVSMSVALFSLILWHTLTMSVEFSQIILFFSILVWVNLLLRVFCWSFQRILLWRRQLANIRRSRKCWTRKIQDSCLFAYIH